MKKKLVVYFAGLLTVVSMGFGSAQFSDVPAGHWAKEAVEQIAACGLIQGFPDGTYRGRENLTRYQAALIFQRLLNELKEGGKCVAAPKAMGDAYDHSALEGRVKALEDAGSGDTSDLEARLAALEDAMGAMEPTDLSDIEGRLAALEEKAGMAMAEPFDASDLEARLAALEDAMGGMAPSEPPAMAEPFDASDLEARIAALEDALASMGVEVEPAAADTTLADRVATLEGALADVDSRLSDVDGRSNDLSARVGILEDVLAGMDEKMSMEPAMSGEDMDVLRNAMQELAAELAALGVRTSALEDNAASKDDIARLEAAIEEMKGGMMMEDKSGVDQAAMADLADRVEAASVAADTALAQAQILAERLDSVEGDVAAIKTQQEADADSIRALNELAVLLNQDVLSLQDRVTAVEKATADLGNINFDDYASKEDVSAVQEFATALRGDLVKLSDKVAALEGKVTALERNSFSISGSLALTYEVRRAWAQPGSAAGAPELFDIDRVFKGTTFSSGDGDEDGLTVDETDLGNAKEGDTTAQFDVTIKSRAFDAVSDPGKLNSYPGLLQFSIRGRWVNADAATGEYATENNASSYFRIYVDAITTTLDIAKGQALEFTFGRAPKAKFTEYIFDNDVTSRGPGFVARFNLGPAQIWGVYGSTGGPNGDNLYYRGARAAFGLGPINLGASFVQEGKDQQAGGGTIATPITVFGVDAKAALGPLSLSGEFFNTDANANGQGFYVMASGDLGPIKLGASFRNIGTGIGNNAGTAPGTTNNMISSDAKDYYAFKGDNAAPFKRGQNGFGVTASATLGIIGLDAYFQNYTLNNGITADDGTYNAFGITAKLTGLGPISLEGFFKSASKNGAAANTIPDEKISDGGTYSTILGVKATLALGFANITAGFESRSVAGTSRVYVYGDAPLNFGIFTGKVIGRFDSTSPGTTTIKYGGELNANLSSLPLAPTLSLMGASRTTGTTNEGVYSVGLTFAQFLFSNSTFNVRYGSYGGQNLAAITIGNQEKALDPTDNDLYTDVGAASGYLTGLFFTWTYWDLTFSYADFDHVNGAVKTHAQAFKIAYKVVF